MAHSQARGRPRSSFEIFYADRADELYRTLAVTLRDSELAREATDEAMVRAYSKWSKVSRYDNPSGWVYRVAYNWAMDQLRRAKSPLMESAGPPVDHPLPRPDVALALDALPIEQRAVVVLRVVHDWSEDAVAYALNIPVGTVKSRLARALQTLRQEVGDE